MAVFGESFSEGSQMRGAWAAMEENSAQFFQLVKVVILASLRLEQSHSGGGRVGGGRGEQPVAGVLGGKEVFGLGA